MNELAGKLGVDWKLLIAQIINFLVLLAILYKFLYKPVLEMMQKRTRRIEEGLEKAEEIEKELAKTKENYNKEISRAKKEANEIIVKARDLAEEKKKEILAKTEEKIAQITEKEKIKIEMQKMQVAKEIKAEVADLLTLSMQKILGERGDLKLDKNLIEKTLSKQPE